MMCFGQVNDVDNILTSNADHFLDARGRSVTNLTVDRTWLEVGRHSSNTPRTAVERPESGDWNHRDRKRDTHFGLTNSAKNT